MLKRFLFLVLLICATAQAAVSPESEKLETLRRQIREKPTAKLEMQYLNSFPSTYKQFSQTFYGRDLHTLDELYDTHFEHLSLLGALSAKYPEKVLSIWMGVATNGHWEADAVGMLQDQLIEYGAEHTQAFAAALIARPAKERQSIIKFLADVENHHSYSAYASTMESLKRLGHVELYQQFAVAKQDRMKLRNH